MRLAGSPPAWATCSGQPPGRALRPLDPAAPPSLGHTPMCRWRATLLLPQGTRGPCTAPPDGASLPSSPVLTPPSRLHPGLRRRPPCPPGGGRGKQAAQVPTSRAEVTTVPARTSAPVPSPLSPQVLPLLALSTLSEPCCCCQLIWLLPLQTRAPVALPDPGAGQGLSEGVQHCLLQGLRPGTAGRGWQGTRPSLEPGAQAPAIYPQELRADHQGVSLP